MLNMIIQLRNLVINFVSESMWFNMHNTTKIYDNKRVFKIQVIWKNTSVWHWILILTLGAIHPSISHLTKKERKVIIRIAYVLRFISLPLPLVQVCFTYLIIYFTLNYKAVCSWELWPIYIHPQALLRKTIIIILVRGQFILACSDHTSFTLPYA